MISSLFVFSKSRITLFSSFAGYPALMNDCFRTLTSAFQLVATRFAGCKVPRIVWHPLPSFC